jgi:hypothetical protein
VGRRIERRADGEELKVPPEKRVCRVSDYDRGDFFRVWVMEWGIKLMDRKPLDVAFNRLVATDEIS